MFAVKLQAIKQIIFIAVLGLLPVSAMAQQYLVDGKPVSLSFAQAMKLVNQAIACIQENKLQEALNIAQKAEKLAPESALTHAILGSAEARNGDPDSAIEEYKTAIAIDDKKPDLWYSLGSVYQSAAGVAKPLRHLSSFLSGFQIILAANW